MIYYMTSLVWLVFALYVNQISHMTMFLTSHTRTMKKRNQTKFQYISVPYGHVLVPLHGTLRILQIIDLQELVSLYSYKRPFQIVYFVLLFFLVLSYFSRHLPKIILDVEDLPPVPSLHHYNAISLPILPYPYLSCASQQKPMNAYFFQGEIEEPVYDRIFHIILC